MKKSFLQFIDVSQLPDLPQFEHIKNPSKYPDNKKNDDLINKKDNNTDNKKDNNTDDKKDNNTDNNFCIIFDNRDHTLNYPIICKKTDTFESVEQKFYSKYTEFSENADKNTFTVRTRPISDKSKTLEELGFKYGDLIILENE